MFIINIEYEQAFFSELNHKKSIFRNKKIKNKIEIKMMKKTITLKFN